jgi:hypothetical protein
MASLLTVALLYLEMSGLSPFLYGPKYTR